MQLEGRVAIVTGAAGGIGLATARALLREGARVMLAGRHQDTLDRARTELERDAPAQHIATGTCDVAHEDQVQDLVRATLRQFGRWDVAVNNAGVMHFKPIAEQVADDWRATLDVDLIGAFHLIKHAFLLMEGGGAVVNVSSVHACATEQLVAPYAAAKAALLSLTRSAAIEGKPKRIRVNAVVPGAIDTPMLWDNPNVKSGAETIDPADVGAPGDVAAAIVFLASPQAAFVNGSALLVDGGRLAHL
ncbi:SDR family NAD(P)-dependent oxidoreductase [uncultured Massilia sp.]|uniref:SDR family NAD(P)-dependent oxidoreductase n=1 Tax=uncultured Massilia sp. TaxID=169973 RepID=UPI0025CF30C9|nr:SDR family oxidoreductase [uncultured Massilia sp.]